MIRKEDTLKKKLNILLFILSKTKKKKKSKQKNQDQVINPSSRKGCPNPFFMAYKNIIISKMATY